MLETLSGSYLELLTLNDLFLRLARGLEKLSRAFIRAAEKMKPERQLFLVVERIGKPCAQAQLSFRDGLAASAAFRAAARRGLDRVRHGASVPAQLASGHKGVPRSEHGEKRSRQKFGLLLVPARRVLIGLRYRKHLRLRV